MKHLKTFENYSINEEGVINKFFTGHDNKEDRNKAKEAFEKSLDEAKAEVDKDPSSYVFLRDVLEKKAKEDNYRGGIRMQRGRNDKFFFVYDKGITGFQKLTGAAAGSVSTRRG